MIQSPNPQIFRNYALAEKALHAIDKNRPDILQEIHAEAVDWDTLVGDDDWMPLHRAIWLDRKDCIQYLLSAGANPNAFTPSGRGVWRGIDIGRKNTQIRRQLQDFTQYGICPKLVSPAGDCALATAIQYDRADFMRQALRVGADVFHVTSNNENFWHVAAQHHSTEAMVILIEHGLSANHGRPPLLFGGELQPWRSPLAVALDTDYSNENESRTAITLLMGAGADAIDRPYWNVHTFADLINHTSDSEFREPLLDYLATKELERRPLAEIAPLIKTIAGARRVMRAHHLNSEHLMSLLSTLPGQSKTALLDAMMDGGYSP